MAIIIPKSKIHNYNFNILQNNYIDSVKLNVKSAYNYEPLVINATSNSLGNWSADSWSDNIANVNITRTAGVASSVINFTYQNENDGYKTYDPITLDIQLSTELIDINNINDLIDNIVIKITYNNGDVEYQNANFSYAENVQQFKKILSPENLGLFVFNNSLYFPSQGRQFGYWYVYGLMLRRIDQDNGGSTVNLIKYAQNVTITINLKQYNESSDYNYSDSDGNNNFELSYSSMFDNRVGFEGTGYWIETPIYESIGENIVENYKNGKMTMEIETRYTTFKDDEDNDVNNGNPYLIKVGDIVKPEMLDKFKDFEYEYIVTSSEYEYDGSDKVYLKLLQVNNE